MLILSQDKEKLYNMSMFQGIEYGTTQNHKHRKGGEPAEDIPTLFLSDGCLDELGRYGSKERCLEIIKDICDAYRQERYFEPIYNMAAQANTPYMNGGNCVYEMPQE